MTAPPMTGGLGTPPAPRRSTVSAITQAPVAKVGAWSPNGSAVVFNASNAVGDSWTVRGDISPGIWSGLAGLNRQPNAGIVQLDYSLDEGATWVNITTIDTYSAGGAYSVVPFGFTATYQRTILIRWTVTGTNASSSGNFAVINPVDLTRTA